MDLKAIAVWLHLVSLLKFALALDKDLSCAVCRALLHEVSYSISKADPKQMLQVGSFRIDSKGNQGTYQRPYAKSEVHLIEVFENVCENFRDYAQTTNDAGKKSLGRINARDGKTLKLKGISISADVQKHLKHKCESLVEEYEEEMIAMFRRDNVPDIEHIICGEVAAQCSEEDLAIPMPETEVDSEDAVNADRDDEPEPGTVPDITEELERVSQDPGTDPSEDTIDVDLDELIATEKKEEL